MMSKTDWAVFLADAGAHVVGASALGKDPTLASDWLAVFNDAMTEVRRYSAA